MSSVGRTFTKLRQQVQAVEDLCARLESSKAPSSLTEVVSEHSSVIQNVIQAVADVQTTLAAGVKQPDALTIRSDVSAKLTLAGSGWVPIPGLTCNVVLDEEAEVHAHFHINCSGSGQTRTFTVAADGVAPYSGSKPVADAHLTWPSDQDQVSTVAADAYLLLPAGSHQLQVYTFCDNGAAFYINRSAADGSPSDRVYTSRLEVRGASKLSVVSPAIQQDVACFTYRSVNQTFHHVPDFLHVERLAPGKYRVTNLVPGESYLVSPPRFVALGNECNDGALCTVVVWTPAMTPDSFEVWFMYNGSLYDGNYGGAAPYDFLTFVLYPRSAPLA